MNAIWKLRGGTFHFGALEGRPLLWSQNASEICLIYLQGCIMSFNSSNIFEKKLWAKNYKIKRNFKNLQKMRRAGTLNMFLFLLGLKGYFDQNMLFLSQISLSLCKRLISLQIYKAQKFQTTCFAGLGQTKIWNFESNFEHDSISLFCQMSCLAGQRWSKISNLSRGGR